MSEPGVLLQVDDVVKHFPLLQGIILRREVGRVHAVDGVSLTVRRGETLGLVGETGCGKSTLARCITRLYDLTSGRVVFDGTDISRLPRRALHPFRREIQMIFQDPYGSLNPRRRVGSIIGDPFAIHGVADGPERKRRVQELMEVVGLNPEHYNRFPAEFEVCRRMRAEGRWAPVLMLTARDAVPDRIRGLDAGADDYLTKPFALAELFARLRAITRRDPLEHPVVMVAGDLSLDPVSRIVRRGGADVALSPKEFALLHELMRRPGEVLSRTHLIDHVWDFAYDGGSNIVDVYVRYLRAKVDRPFGRHTIRTVRGAGYRLDPDG